MKVYATNIDRTERKTEECNEIKCSAVLLYSSLGTVAMCFGMEPSVTFSVFWLGLKHHTLQHFIIIPPIGLFMGTCIFYSKIQF